VGRLDLPEMRLQGRQIRQGACAELKRSGVPSCARPRGTEPAPPRYPS
jgi:hypothetical protein